MNDSQRTQKIFELAIEHIEEALTTGVNSGNEKEVDVAMRAFVGHIKVLNTELKRDSLKFAVNTSMHNKTEELKEILPKTLPEYCTK